MKKSRLWIGFCHAVILFAVMECWSQNVPPGSQPVYLNPDLPIDQRVDDLVARMTLEEKASQVVHSAAAIPRLQVPAYNWWTEALHGVASGVATVFPEPIGLAATFDTPLIHTMAVVIGTEARAKHLEDIRHGNYLGVGLDFWAPNLNVFRDPRWGRGQETYGEDPYLTGRMGVAYVTGMQGDDPRYLRVISTPKHYAVHSGPEPLRHTMDVRVSKHDEEDTYLWAFRAAVTEGKAGSVMCVYNRVNGEPGCANSFLLEDQLRDKWKFQGYVVSDCDAVLDIYRGHHFVKSAAEAGAISIKRGTDLDCNDPGNDYSRYVDAVKQGLMTEKDLDVAVKRLMRARFELGMFDPPQMVSYAQIPFSENDSEAHRQLALQAARESMVLLKNDGVLPLPQDTKKIAVIGPLADQIEVLEGNYAGSPSRATTALDGIRKQFPNARVRFAPGTFFLHSNDPIPAWALSTDDGKPGLKAEYFQGRDLQGDPVAARTDPQVDFVFTGRNPVPGLGPDNFSARWSGFVKPKVSGTYYVGVRGDDGCRLYFEGKLIVDQWSICGSSTVKIRLEKGHKYALKLEYYQGGGGADVRLVWSAPQSDPLKVALSEAKKADVVIAVVGITPELEGEEMPIDIPGFKGGDRTSLEIPKPEEDLLEALKATHKTLVIVLMNGSALAVNWANQNANAILEAWYAGEEGGSAIAETLAGTNNPAGRLPITFYKGVDQLPPFEDYAMKNRTYRYFTGDPLYPFGFGLSYTKFAYSNLKLSSLTLDAGASLEVDADVHNTGSRDGDEVAELYLVPPQTAGSPRRTLRAFTRVHVPANATQHLHFTLNPRDLSTVNEAGDRYVLEANIACRLAAGNRERARRAWSLASSSRVSKNSPSNGRSGTIVSRTFPGGSMKKLLIGVCGILLGWSSLCAASKEKYQTFTGEITDSMCAQAGSHQETMKKVGAKDANDCADKCVRAGAKYVLVDAASKTVYQLDDQVNAYEFAGYKVAVTGKYNPENKTIWVHDIEVTSW
jgi:beta-glucosidase